MAIKSKNKPAAVVENKQQTVQKHETQELPVEVPAEESTAHEEPVTVSVPTEVETEVPANSDEPTVADSTTHVLVSNVKNSVLTTIESLSLAEKSEFLKELSRHVNLNTKEVNAALKAQKTAQEAKLSPVERSKNKAQNLGSKIYRLLRNEKYQEAHKVSFELRAEMEILMAEIAKAPRDGSTPASETDSVEEPIQDTEA